jgi:hypothetical protein
MADRSLQIRPIAGALGAEITGVIFQKTSTMVRSP